MTAYNATALLDELSSDVRTILVYTETLKSKSEAELNKPAVNGGWSAAQVLAHLNFYARYYLPEIEKGMSRMDRASNGFFKSGWFGNYFTKLMLPKADGRVKSKMKSPKNAVPANNPDARKELDTFIAYQHQLLNVLEIAKKSNLGKIKIATSLTKLIKLKLGDTFRFVIAHEQRHVEQMKRLLG